ncbi:MAG: sigma54 specific transcriptional regulator, Fis family [Bryobacterales bacterium]|nr:sigma54 specific transcriptional regulator, Fis family [Bryobacterales bacterium]
MRPPTRLLWIRTDTPGPAEVDLLQNLGDFTVHVTNSPNDALERVRIETADVVLAEFPLPGWEPAELLERIQEISLRIPVLILDPAGAVSDAIRLIKLGAYHFMTAAEQNELIGWLEMAAEKWRLRASAVRVSAPDVEPWKCTLVGESRAIRNVEHVVRLVGPKRATVLITGETGTGKEVVARALHQASPRAHLPMVAVNCSALPESLLEAELFGHVKGAFTGAMHQRIGRFEQAQSSTLFLDEIGEMPLELQAKLLRVLQEREFQRIGSSETVRVDVRVVAASNLNLQEKVEQGTFREDLFYRLNVVPIEMPPLRERAADIPLLVHYFLEKICRLEGIPVKRISREALDRLSAHAWPGNIRQLQNAIEMAVVLSEDRMDLCPADFRLPTQQTARYIPSVPSQAMVPDSGLDFDLTVANFERSLLEQAVERSGGNKTVAADLLRMKRTTLLAKLRNLETRGTVVSIKSA